MSDVGKAFLGALGKPDPKAPNGLQFTDDFGTMFWNRMYKEIGAGWYMNRFLYLFGPGLDRLQACLEAWSFLVAPGHPDRIVVGRNAYGALLVVEDNFTVHVLDPYRVVYWSDPNLSFVGLIGNFLPLNKIPYFLDDARYKAWIKERGEPLEDDVILAPLTPSGLIDDFESFNWHEEEIVSFYQATGPIYAKAFERMGRRPPEPIVTKKGRKGKSG